MSATKKQKVAEGVKVVMFGGGGFLASLVSKALVDSPKINVSPTTELPVKKIVLFDVAEPKFLHESVAKSDMVSVQTGDITDKKTVEDALAPGDCSRVTVFHFAGLLSGQGEIDFEKCISVNLMGTLNILDRLREVGDKLGSPQIIVFTSTNAVFAPTDTISDATPVLPFTTYGVTKASCDLFMCDYTRKGFLDARIARLPSIIGRPIANNAASNVFSAIFRDTLQGKDFEVPVPLETRHPVSSPANLTNCLLFLAGKLDTAKAGHNRVVILPARSFTLQEMWDTAQEVGKELGLTMGKVTVKLDETVKRVVDTWPPNVDHSRALELGLPNSMDLKDIITGFAKEHVVKK
eukprot:TRINITY_DN66067_c0_g1_i1.p1 TRINITY_DN66067_c0_g1~~TRINITY_DN66067_c0_g1_i1.p1  ORF type:complete len:357 (-),score=47.74 TRINITY_DN66067_c0_g1_i1:556-1605(-)